ncbi:DUF448 domain-containing protein [Sphingomonas segetis]|uniref:DUF448 domain-containing protein n=1 Tax=Sphingomonas segetis TaxID=1104779 RepID=UPI0012D2D618|nr:DUF448 domain-containing protein [Sphingomonas segetis]
MRNPRNDNLALALRQPHVPERTCVLTRRKGTKDELIRLALGPDGSVAPDARARAPGRGAWIGVNRADLDAANAKGKLKPALSRAYKTNDVTVPADLGARIEAALRQTALDRLGMEARAGNLVNGTERIETAARSGKIHLLIHAADSGEDGRRALDQAWRVGGGGPRGMIFPEGRTILSMALGRENVVHVALTDPAAASRVAHALARWRAFTGPERGPEGGEPASGTGSAEADLTKD